MSAGQDGDQGAGDYLILAEDDCAGSIMSPLHLRSRGFDTVDDVIVSLCQCRHLRTITQFGVGETPGSVRQHGGVAEKTLDL